MKNKKYKRGFTLAEVLITLGIIGVVAAITIPNVINSFRVKIHESKFKSTNTLIQEALKRAIYETSYDMNDFYIPQGQVTDENFKELKDRVTILNEYFLKQFKNAKGYPIKYGSPTCKNIKGNTIPSLYNCYTSGGATYLLPDGRLISVFIASRESSPWNDAGIKMIFDTNGPQNGPNRIGHDVWGYTNFIDKAGRLKYINGCCKNAYSDGIGCAYMATINKNDTGKSNSYWDMLYKSESYFNN